MGGKVTNHFSTEADVIVLGYGGAGASAAIAAHDAGAEVVIVDKGDGGGNTRLATLTFLCPVKGSAAKEHIRALSRGTIDDDVIDTFIEWSSRNIDFLRTLGGEVELCPPGPTFPVLPGSDAMARYRVKGKLGEPGGESLWRLLSENVEMRGIQVCRQTPATKLMRVGHEIIGVEAEGGGGRLAIRARRGVVLATGGFEYNEEMKTEYLAGYPIHAYGHRLNQGDGIRLAQDVGADLWHMKAVAAPMGYKFPEYEAAFMMNMPANGFIIVDQEGSRFCDETGLEHYSMWMEVTRFDTRRLRFTRIPSYVIFDQATCLQGPITKLGHGANRAYSWSRDNAKEIERGWIVTANDPVELGRRLGIDRAKQLGETLAAYNQSCRTGNDKQFGRSKDTLVELCGILHGVPLWPCLLNTQGGPKRNARGEILDVWGGPIKRLYGAGEMGSIWGFLYQSGGNLGECLASGRIAGLHAASEVPLT